MVNIKGCISKDTSFLYISYRDKYKKENKL